MLIPLTEIRPSTSRAQAVRRAGFHAADIEALAATMAAEGQLQPVIVRPLEAGDLDGDDGGPRRWELVAGERRLAAAAHLGWTEIRAEELARGDRASVLTAQLVENVQREAAHPITVAHACGELREAGLSADEVADRLGVARSTVHARLRLLLLAAECLEAVAAGRMTLGAADLVARFPAHVQPGLLEVAAAPTGEPSGVPGEEAPSEGEVDDALRRYHVAMLADAPWRVDRRFEEGVPCADCPSMSGNAGAAAYGDAACLDVACFATRSHVVAVERQERMIQRGAKPAPAGVWREDDYHGVSLKGGWIEYRRTSWIDSIASSVNPSTIEKEHRPPVYAALRPAAEGWAPDDRGVAAAVEIVRVRDAADASCDARGADRPAVARRAERDARQRQDARDAVAREVWGIERRAFAPDGGKSLGRPDWELLRAAALEILRHAAWTIRYADDGQRIDEDVVRNASKAELGGLLRSLVDARPMAHDPGAYLEAAAGRGIAPVAAMLEEAGLGDEAVGLDGAAS